MLEPLGVLERCTCWDKIKVLTKGKFPPAVKISVIIYNDYTFGHQQLQSPGIFFYFIFFFEQCLHDKWLLLVPNRMITIAANLKDSRADAQGTWAVIQSLKRKLHFYLAAWYCQTVCVTFFFLSLLPVHLNKRCDRTQSSSVWSVSSSNRSVKFAHNPVSCDYLRLWWFITVGFCFSLSVSTIF